MKIYFDSRWCGTHGIGRFATEVRKTEIGFIDLPLQGNPASKFDVFKLTFVLARLNGFFFSPGYNAPLFFLNRTIITVHDLNHIDLNYNSSILKRLYYKLILKRACLKSAKILTVSDFSKSRIVKWSGVPEEKVFVVGNGVSQEFNIEGDKYQPGFPYVFVVGNRKFHKNEARVLEAFHLSTLPPEVKLVFSGKISDELHNIINEYGLSDKVVFLGTLSNMELASCYRGAEVLLFPSLYEGFGLPVIEAMACGIPVITSNTTSLKEIASDAACLVNPESIIEIKSALEKIFKDDNYKNDLVERGRIQSQKFTWNKTRNKVKILLGDIS
ncbi:glycosyltransferase family 4 protein [Rahnella sp. L72c]|uniref:Glycosyltransferase family 4 protein n=1 Tax=Rahnella perminowiae TaxID=2816244 RepID=A0ABS6L8E5_9GAMM|nr:glycosyltransferase family 1 protein [Rahnella perminowiae]MBU9838116.1 glycosyltransferase family 4 protein [Rahnella perminowiae]